MERDPWANCQYIKTVVKIIAQLLLVVLHMQYYSRSRWKNTTSTPLVIHILTLQRTGCFIKHERFVCHCSKIRSKTIFYLIAEMPGCGLNTKMFAPVVPVLASSLTLGPDWFQSSVAVQKLSQAKLFFKPTPGSFHRTWHLLSFVLNTQPKPQELLSMLLGSSFSKYALTAAGLMK